MADKKQRATRETRRAMQGRAWITELAGSGGGSCHLARRGDGAVFLVDGSTKRAVKSGILAAGLELALGPIKEQADADLDSRSDGVPVELFEDENGRTFVIYGGERHNVRGVPLSHPVTNDLAAKFSKGHDINVAKANVSYRRLRQAMSAGYQVDRVRAAVRRKGIVGTAKTAARRGTKALKKRPSQ